MLSKGSITEMNGLVRGYKVLSRDRGLFIESGGQVMGYRCRFNDFTLLLALLGNPIREEDWRIFVLLCLKLHHFFSFEHKM
ncbi:Uncharacterised protein [Klebsiella michiganensis]|uniref:Uncharacterized protein n=1 Tax=Klebsiella michiganensis TaxID=1134687 RepID=A0A7H4M2C4_9ENTR|nr:Uncharacterised protein [Klebsiella michiganensis]